VHLATRDPREALDLLWHRGVRDVWLEGGPTLASAFLGAGLVDDVYAYVAPALLGSGFSAIGDLGAESIEQLRRFNLADVTRLGDDVRLTLTPLGGK
jgi:diaminohydroxyphosphoribosylaminopyrimidine deaminase / 5-amino-6-(5-phosphoribosylamino)uracil reductase